MRLRSQLLLLTLGPLLGATTLYAVMAWPVADRALRESREREARQRLASESAALQRDVETLQARLDAYASLPAISEGTPASIAATVIPLRAGIPGVDVLNFIAADGTVIRLDGSKLSVKDRYYFPALQRGEPVVSKTIVSVDSHQPELLVLRPVRNKAHVVVGALGVSVLISGLVQQVASIRVGDNGFALLVDEDGATLASVARAADSTTSANSPEWQALVDALKHGRAGQQSLAIDDVRYTAFFEQVPEMRWGLALVYRDDDLLATRNRVGKVSLLVLLAAVFAAVLAAIQVRRRLVQPVSDLLEAHAAVAGGDLQRRAAESTKDELGELAQSFNRMTERLAANQARLDEEAASRASALQAKADREAMFRAVFDTSPFAIAIFRASDGTYVRVNAAFLRDRGLTESDVVGRSIDEVNYIDDAELRARIRSLREREGSVYNERFSSTAPDGSTRELLLSSTTFSLDGEQLVMSMTTDISETVRLEAQLRQSQKLEVVGQLAGGVAHDFNNMLAGILGNADLMKMTLLPDAVEHEHLDIILDSARRAATLTQQLLMFSRVQPLAMQRLDAHAPIRAALTLTARTFDRRIEIREQLDASDSAVMGDATLLQNVVMNLAVNARDAMPDGGVLTVRTQNVALDGGELVELGLPSAPTQYVRIEVTDSGIGMAPSVRDRIFEPFFTTKEVGRGTGLGLAVVYGTVREHGGQITVQSAPGRGTTFVVHLPSVVGRHATPADAQRPVARGKGVVLVVDDEHSVRETGRRMLETLGYDVLTAADGHEALTVFDANRDAISVVLLDLIMPRMDGETLFAELRARDPRVPVVVCTGFSSEATQRSLLAHDRVQSLAKPYGIAEMSEVIAAAVASRASD